MKDRVAKMLFEMDAVNFRFDKPYNYASGLRGPCYVDNRAFQGKPEFESKVVDGLVDLIKIKYNGAMNHYPFAVRIAYIASGAITWGTLIRQRLNLPGFYVSKKDKDHGLPGKINGPEPNRGDKVILVEDLITTGGSSLDAIEVIRNAGGVVEDVYSVFSYDLKQSEESFHKARCELVSLTNLDALLKNAKDFGELSDEQIRKIKEWQADPVNVANEWWGLKNE